MADYDPEKQRRFAVEVVQKLREVGHVAYWAGGCVRDRILGRTPGDFDVATNARPEEIQRVFARRRTLAVGAAYGVIAIVGPHGAGQVEVTTFRSDADYLDGRHPSRVVFSSPEEDAERRDFTINGMFYDPIAETVIDFVGGQADLRRGVIRAIGDPRARFGEDKLRMLRAVRFAARFEFELDADTAAAIREMAVKLSVVSAERISAEMESMLLDRHRARAVRMLRETGLLEVVLGEGSWGRGQGTRDEEVAWEQMVEVLEALVEPTFALALAVLWQVCDGTEVAVRMGRRWRLAKKHFQRAGWLMEHRGELTGAQRLPWSQLQPLLVHEGVDELLAMGNAMVEAGQLDSAELQYCRQKLALPLELLDPTPLLTGEDLIALGVPSGHLYSVLLKEIRDCQLDGRLADRSDAVRFVREFLDGSHGAG